MKKTSSIKDIAREAGVSAALVSYVLNNKRENRVAKETAERIRNAAKKLNYKVNFLAQSLKTNRTNTLGVIVADIGNPFSASLARIIENEAAQKNYTTIIGSSDEEEIKFEKLVDTLLDRKVDGFIISPPCNTEHIIEKIKGSGKPFVIIDRYFPMIETNYVIIDNYAASYEATMHLLQNGRTRVGMITYDTPLLHLEDRKKGYLAAASSNRLHEENKYLKEVSIHNDEEEIIKALNDLLNIPDPVDALFFGSNNIAACCLKKINSLPIKVPGQLALVSFDQAELLNVFYSPVTYIQQPLERMAQQALDILCAAMKDQSVLIKVKLPASLIIQQSSQTS